MKSKLPTECAVAVLAVACLSSLAARVAAQDDSYGLHEKHIERMTAAQEAAPVALDGFGEQIGYFDGSLSFNVADISIPGNSGLPVELRRQFAVRDRREFDDGPTKKGHLGGFGEWDLDIPHLSGTFKASIGWQVAGPDPKKRCSAPAAPIDYPTFSSQDYWNGYQLSLPGGATESLLANPAPEILKTSQYPANAAYPWVTRSLWRVGCLASAKGDGATGRNSGEAFVATSPDGTRYFFDWVLVREAPSIRAGGYSSQYPVMDTMQRENVYFAVSRIEDRFGNWVNYSYQNGKLQGISANDGRYINLAWSGDRIVSASSSLGNWTYQYDGQGNLASVTRPDGSRWTYARTGKLLLRSPPAPGEDDIDFDECSELNPIQSPSCEYQDQIPPGQEEGDIFADCPEPEAPVGTAIVYTVTHPAGATATYTLGPGRTYRSNVLHMCIKPSADYEYLRVPNFSDGFMLQSKTVTGPNVEPMTWTYEISGGHGLAFAAVCGTPGSVACPASRTMEIEGPGNTWERHRFGILYGINEGQLLKVERGSSASSVLQSTSYTYVSEQEAASQPFPNRVGNNLLPFSDLLATSLRPMKQQVIQQQGVNFVRTVTSFDELTNPLSVQVSGTESRVESTQYESRFDDWILSLPKRRSINGTEVEEITYNDAGLPYEVSQDGLPPIRLTYNTDGTLYRQTNALNQTTTFTGWKRGVPGMITHPDGRRQQAVVSNQGWITRVTDENGYSTSFTYDAMGRLTRKTYPGSGWHPTVIEFERVSFNDPNSGLVAGHWRRTETTGNHIRRTWFDGLWRPVMSHEYDRLAASTTGRSQAWGYDDAGRRDFETYPTDNTPNYGSLMNLDGVETRYDAIGRVTSQRQDSEQGVLTTHTNYLGNFETEVVDAEGNATVTSYQAFGEPDTSRPKDIIAPEGVSTTISRNAFGLPVSITRLDLANGGSHVQRRYLYDAYRRLCRMIEPEAGDTVYAYDDVSNVVWSATGQGSASQPATTCSPHTVPASDRVSYFYDARGRVYRKDYPDGNSTETRTYHADGALKSVKLWNEDGYASVTTSYDYNERRQLTSESQSQSGGLATWTIDYGYDAHGNLAEIVYPAGLTVRYAPNALGQPTSVQSDTRTFASQVRFWPNGSLRSFTYGNGIVRTVEQNDRQLPARIRDAKGSVEYLDDVISYDKVGNVRSLLDSRTSKPIDMSRTMVYDDLNRLVGVTSPMYGANGAAYTYDGFDNLRSVVAPGRNHAYCYDARNRLASIRNGSCSGSVAKPLSYDARGNVTSTGGLAYEFDLANRLRTAGNETYRYDGLGRRVLQDSPLGKIYSMYSRDGKLLWSRDERISRRRHSIYLAGSIIAERLRPIGSDEETIKYQHTDMLGTPVAVSSDSSNPSVVNTFEYEPYGRLMNDPHDDTTGYTGHVMDKSSGLLYMQQRYYDPVIGRFLSVDPVMTDPGNGHYFNRYWYANGNPYRFTDPDGREAVDDYGTPASQCPGCVLRPMGPNGERAYVARAVVVDSLMASAHGEDSLEDYNSLDQQEASNGLGLVSTFMGVVTIVLPNPVTAFISTVTGIGSVAVDPSEEDAVAAAVSLVGGRVKPVSEAVGNGIEGGAMIFDHREDIRTVVRELAPDSDDSSTRTETESTRE